MSVSEKLTTIAENVDRVFTSGRYIGNDEGYVLGREAGKREGYDDGYQKGYDAGFTAGGDNAFQEGYADGVTAGIDQGKQAAYDEFWNDFQQNGTRTTYAHAFSGVGWTDKTFKPKYPIKIVETSAGQSNALGMFKYFRRSQKNTDATPIVLTPDIVDFSECKNANQAFNNAWFDEVTVDFGNAENLNDTFASNDGGGGIRKINLRVTDKAKSYSNTFLYAQWTEELIFTDDSVIAASVDLRRSQLLSKASFLSIAHALSPDVTATLTVSKTAVDAAFPNSTEWDALFSDKPNWTIVLF